MGFQTVYRADHWEGVIDDFNDPSSYLQIMFTAESASLDARRIAMAWGELSKDSSRPSVSSSQTGAMTNSVAERPVVNEGDVLTPKRCKIFL